MIKKIITNNLLELKQLQNVSENAVGVPGVLPALNVGEERESLLPPEEFEYLGTFTSSSNSFTNRCMGDQTRPRPSSEAIFSLEFGNLAGPDLLLSKTPREARSVSSTALSGFSSDLVAYQPSRTNLSYQFTLSISTGKKYLKRNVNIRWLTE